MPYLTALDPAMYTVNELIERSMPTDTPSTGDAQSSPALDVRCSDCDWAGKDGETVTEHGYIERCPNCGSSKLEDA